MADKANNERVVDDKRIVDGQGRTVSGKGREADGKEMAGASERRGAVGTPNPMKVKRRTSPAAGKLPAEAGAPSDRDAVHLPAADEPSPGGSPDSRQRRMADGAPTQPAGKRPTGRRREQIARAVMDIIAKDGLAGLSAASVSSAVGIVPSALYRHFQGIDEMIVAAVELLATEAIERFGGRMAAVPDPRDRLRLVMEVHRRMLPMSIAMPHIVFASHPAQRRTVLLAAVRRVQDRMIAALAGVIRDGQRAGVFRTGLDPEAAGWQYFSILIGTNIRYIVAGDDFDVDAFKRQACEIFIQGIAAAGAPDRISPTNREHGEDKHA